MAHCVDFDCENNNFLHSSLYGAGFWICIVNSVDNTEKLWLFLSSTMHSINTFPASPTAPPGGQGCAESWKETQAGQLSQTDQRDIPYHMASFQYIKLREEGGSVDVQRDGVCFLKSKFHVMEPCFPGVD